VYKYKKLKLKQTLKTLKCDNLKKKFVNDENFEIFEYLFKPRRKGLCLGKKMWLSAALLLTMVLTLDSS